AINADNCCLQEAGSVDVTKSALNGMLDVCRFTIKVKEYLFARHPEQGVITAGLIEHVLDRQKIRRSGMYCYGKRKGLHAFLLQVRATRIIRFAWFSGLRGVDNTLNECSRCFPPHRSMQKQCACPLDWTTFQPFLPATSMTVSCPQVPGPDGMLVNHRGASHGKEERCPCR